MAQTWTVGVGADQTLVAWDPPAGNDAGTVFVCAHGAGGHMSDKAILGVSEVLRSHGIGIVRFNFLYRARGAGGPDPMPRLIACFQAVVNHVRTELQPKTVILGGRSMGGRAASVWVSEGAVCDGLLLLAYPLHPPGHPEKIRDAHLPAIKVPVLCINGTRDPFCDPPLMKKTLARLGANWLMLWLDEADHSFHVPKRSGRTDRDVLEHVADEVNAWRTRSSSRGA
jgi:predicted alpha/beta-hydrolase family hydrolase